MVPYSGASSDHTVRVVIIRKRELPTSLKYLANFKTAVGHLTILIFERKINVYQAVFLDSLLQRPAYSKVGLLSKY